MTTATWSVDFCSSAASSASIRRVVVGRQQAGLVGDAAGQNREVRLGCAAPMVASHAKRNEQCAAARGAQLKGEAHRAADIVGLL